MSKMLRSADPMIKDEYVTIVLTADRYGFPTNHNPLYKREYFHIEEARAGHIETVKRLSKGKLKLKRIYLFEF